MEDVLLTNKEQYEAIKDREGNPAPYLCKAQCLKLLEWLNQSCPHATDDFGEVCTQYARFNCPECMSELEALLKEAR